MATTYDELKAEVASWLARDDLTTDIPLFIYKAEQRIKRKLNIAEYEATNTQVSVAGQPNYPLPTDYKSMRAVWITLNSGELVELTYATPAEFARRSVAGHNYVAIYTIRGEEILLGPGNVAAGHTLEQHYNGYLVHLSASVPTNWLLEHADDCLLWGALTVAAGFNKDLNGISAWKDQYDEALAELEVFWDNFRFGGGGLVMRTE